jgi:hypothetical protein
MNPKDIVECRGFPCLDVNHSAYIVPNIEIVPEKVSIVVISEAAPLSADDFYYAGGEASFRQTSVQAFKAAGAKIGSFQDILDLGIYFTSAVKCAKKGYPGVLAIARKGVGPFFLCESLLAYGRCGYQSGQLYCQEGG